MAKSVHPHACGENKKYVLDKRPYCGTPPRVWGKRLTDIAGQGDHRYTPTRVGKTLSLWSHRRSPSVHPHACGENAALPAGHKVPCGTPPRVWGKQRDRVPAERDDRYTPTRVGKTRCAPGAWPGRPVHPHACGENPGHLLGIVGGVGTPPRVWGKRLAHHRHAIGLRYTPTRVGKTLRVITALGFADQQQPFVVYYLSLCTAMHLDCETLLIVRAPDHDHAT